MTKKLASFFSATHASDISHDPAENDLQVVDQRTADPYLKLPIKAVANKAGATSAVLDVLKIFDLLPDSAEVRLPVVTALYGCSPATVWRGVKAGRIPAPRKHSPRITTWNVGELRAAKKRAA